MALRHRLARRAVLALLALALPLLVSAPAVAAAEPAPPSLPPAEIRWTETAVDGSVLVHLYFGWTSTCPHCAKARPFVAELSAALPWLVVHSYQLDGDANRPNVDLLVALAASIGAQLSSVPAFIYDGRMETGFDEASTTGARLRAALEAVHERATAAAGPGTSAGPDASPGAGPDEVVAVPVLGDIRLAGLALPAVTVILAGLDAVNPCALSVLLFLLGILVGLGNRRRMLLVGMTFVVVSGIAYFAFMAAWLNVFLLFGTLRIVTLLAGVAAIAAALINIKDFAWFGRGPSLVIPQAARPGIFGRLLEIPDRARLPALLGATVAVAAVANLYEAICTGGFPVVFTRILTLNQLSTAEFYLWIAAYCLVYVVPLLAIVAAFTWRFRSHTVTVVEARRLKLLSGLLMLGLGLLLVLAPDRLGDMAATLTVFGLAVGAWGALLLLERGRSAPPPPAPPAAKRHGADRRRAHPVR